VQAVTRRLGDGEHPISSEPCDLAILPMSSRTPRTAVLAIDLVSDFRFDDGLALRDRLRPVAPAIGALLRRARRAKVPVIYVNDHVGRWRDTFHDLVPRARHGHGADIVRRIAPTRADYHVVKPRRSGFLYTPLALLLSDLGAKRIVLVGVSTDMCILATAADAQNRKLEVVVPADCCCALTDARHAQAIALLRDSIGADVRPSDRLRAF
jgi:nicotinamidase-related amidase